MGAAVSGALFVGCGCDVPEPLPVPEATARRSAFDSPHLAWAAGGLPWGGGSPCARAPGSYIWV